MKLKSSVIIASVLALVVAAWMLSGLIGGKPEAAVSDPAAASSSEEAAPTVRVKTYTADRRELKVKVFGQTEVNRKVLLRAETKGRVTALNADKGAVVKAGGRIVTLDVADRSARRDRAKAETEHRRIAYDAAKKLASKQFQSQIKLAESAAALARATADLRIIEEEISDTRINAPFAGVVNDVSVEIGDYLKDGDEVAVVVELDPIVIVAEVTETWISGVHVGAVSTVELAGGRTLIGGVRFVSRVATEETRTFHVEVEAPNPGGLLGEGITAQVTIPAGNVRAHFISPALLTLDDLGRLGLKAVSRENRVLFYPINIVEDSTEGMWVAGLPETVTLITVGQEFVRIGGLVTPSEDGA
ncbi:MAG: efflux RND transporter periplasmic adaptor subunit [Rhodospirillales bacterium]